MKVWIDTDSGTWGGMGNDPIRVVDLDESQLEIIESASDSEIIGFGLDFGHRVIAYEWVDQGDV